MKANLYELTQEYKQALYALEEYAESHGGEIEEGIEAAFAMIEESREQKMTNVSKAIFIYRAQIEGCKAEQDRLKKLEKSFVSREKWLIGMLDNCLQDGEKFENEVCRISRKTNPPKVVVSAEDYDKVPDVFWKIEKRRTLDKKEIKEALQGGGQVPGARLVQETRLEVK